MKPVEGVGGAGYGRVKKGSELFVKFVLTFLPCPGYVSGVLGISRETMDASMEDLSDLTAWQEGLVRDIVVWLNEILKLVKDEQA